eukprot:GFYU01000690.1.p1 GENE.GFYU01000690.1~~GFYU01000690.1.p1  ORF type:complete len:317 (+),score=92.97 GFYU01000690.1:63-1013(+)
MSNQEQEHQQRMGTLNQMFQLSMSAANPDQVAEAARNPQPMDADRREFLEAAIQGASGGVVVDEAKEMQQNIEKIRTSNNPEEIEQYLEDLQYYVESGDHASNLPSMGGVQLCLDLMDHEDVGVRANAAWVLATAVQHNPPVQDAVLSAGGLTRFLTLLEKDKEAEVRQKALYAVSATVRDHEEALKQFESAHGYEIVSKVFVTNTRSVGITRKAVWLVYSLLRKSENAIAGVRDSGCLNAISNLLGGDDIDTLEKVLEIISILNQDTESASVLSSMDIRKDVQTTSDRLEGFVSAGDDSWKVASDRAKTLLQELK